MADRIVGADPAELARYLTMARQGGGGTKLEHQVLFALNAIKGYAQAQVGLADDANGRTGWRAR
jgi:hypothetical protein